jgi:hypothetical protein
MRVIWSLSTMESKYYKMVLIKSSGSSLFWLWSTTNQAWNDCGPYVPIDGGHKKYKGGFELTLHILLPPLSPMHFEFGKYIKAVYFLQIDVSNKTTLWSIKLWQFNPCILFCNDYGSFILGVISHPPIETPFYFNLRPFLNLGLTPVLAPEHTILLQGTNF